MWLYLLPLGTLGGSLRRKRKWQRQEARQTNANVCHFEEWYAQPTCTQHTHTPAHILLVCHFVTAPPGSQQQGEKKGRENSTQVAFVVKSYLFISFLYFFFAANSAHSVSPFLFIFICWLLISIYILYCLSSRSCNFLAWVRKKRERNDATKA